ncbi:hypothetical protein B484DRAFT_397307, partial [Ochromonadaceae sp. CCMP2298]
MFPNPSPNRPSGPAVEARQHAEERVTRARVLRSAQVGAATTDGTVAAGDHEQQGAHGRLPAGARRGNQGRPASVRAGRDAQAASAPDLVAHRGTAGPGHADRDTTEHAGATGHGRGDAALARRQLAQRHRRERQEREESASSRSLGSHDTADEDEASASDNSAGTPKELAGAAAARRPQRAAERGTDGGREAARRTAQHQELPAYHPPPHLSDSNAGEQRARGPPHAAPAQAQAHASQGSSGSGPALPPGEEPRTAHTPSPKRAMEESAAADEHRRRSQVARAYPPSHLGAKRAAQAARVRALWSQGGEAPSTGAGMGEMADMADMGASEHAIAARASPHAAP